MLSNINFYEFELINSTTSSIVDVIYIDQDSRTAIKYSVFLAHSHMQVEN